MNSGKGKYSGGLHIVVRVVQSLMYLNVGKKNYLDKLVLYNLCKSSETAPLIILIVVIKSNFSLTVTDNLIIYTYIYIYQHHVYNFRGKR